MACPNASSTVTIPASGTATIVPVDSTTCAPLDATKVVGVIVAGGQVTLTASTQPSMVTDSAGIHLAANGLALGSSFPITFNYTPNGKTWVMQALVGQTVAPTGTTTTP